MATEWHHARDGEQTGPVSFDELKWRASAGLLRADDLVWCEGMTGWEPAARIAGLIPGKVTEWYYSQRGEKYGPVSGDDLKQLTVAGRLQPSDLVWCEGEPEWKPAAQVARLFHSFPVDEGTSQPKGVIRLVKEYAASDEAKAVLERAKQTASNVGGRVKDVAVGVGGKVKDVAKKVKDYAGSDDAKAAMGTAWRRAEEVGGRAKVAATSLGTGGTGFLENKVVIAMSMLFCFPIGLIFVWRHSLWTKTTKWVWTGAFVAFFIIGMNQLAEQRKSDQNSLAEADAQWQAGEKAAAVAKYRPILHRLLQNEKPLAYGRVIDYEVEGGNARGARKLLEEAIGRGVSPSVNNHEAKALQAKIESKAAEAKTLLSKREEAKVDQANTGNMTDSGTIVRVASDGRVQHQRVREASPDAAPGEIRIFPEAMRASLPGAKIGSQYILKLKDHPHCAISGLDSEDNVNFAITFDTPPKNTGGTKILLIFGGIRVEGSAMQGGGLFLATLDTDRKTFMSIVDYRGPVKVRVGSEEILFFSLEGDLHDSISRFAHLINNKIIPSDGSRVEPQVKNVRRAASKSGETLADSSTAMTTGPFFYATGYIQQLKLKYQAGFRDDAMRDMMSNDLQVANFDRPIRVTVVDRRPDFTTVRIEEERPELAARAMSRGTRMYVPNPKNW